MTKKALRIVTVVGARPQFVKAAAVSRAFADFNHAQDEIRIEEQIIHTGQHYDENMSKVFFEELSIPHPSVNLEVGSAAHGKQTGEMLHRLEAIFTEMQPDWVLVYGDTNSTLAGALAAVKMHIPIAHVEAGLRSFNRKMPEEINRILTDQISDLLFCPTDTSVSHLSREGITKGVYQVGDVMRDAFEFNLQLSSKNSTIVDRLKLLPHEYALVTVHRAENTDEPVVFQGIIEALTRLAKSGETVIFPAHPRTRSILEKLGIESLSGKFRKIEPVPYLDMLALERNARMILTDSGGVQKEASWAGIPCITLRNETEWVETVEAGCNKLAGTQVENILQAIEWAKERGVIQPDPATSPGASEQIAKILAQVKMA